MRFRSRWMMSQSLKGYNRNWWVSFKWEVKVTGVCVTLHSTLTSAMPYIVCLIHVTLTQTAFLCWCIKPWNISAWCNLVHLNRTWRARTSRCNLTSWVGEQAAGCRSRMLSLSILTSKLPALQSPACLCVHVSISTSQIMHEEKSVSRLFGPQGRIASQVSLTLLV